MKKFYPVQYGIYLPYPYYPALMEETGQLHLALEVRHSGIEPIDWNEARAMLHSCREQLCEHDPRTAREVVAVGILLRQMLPPYLRQWIPVALE